jgi:hypothetical protein
MTSPRAAWTESYDGFPEEWGGFCTGRDIESAMPYRISALLGPDGEPLKVPLPRHKLGFDLTGGRE